MVALQDIDLDIEENDSLRSQEKGLKNERREIKIFRPCKEKIDYPNQRMIRKQPNRVYGGPALIHNALLGGAYHRSDGLALPEARIKAWDRRRQ